MSAALHLRCHAKLNLVLRVLGRRADGYHLLETLLHPLQLHDELWMARAGHGIALRLEAETERCRVDAGDDNLVVRAARLLLERTGAGGGFRCLLRKRIPAGAGLGGGSSDAAATLRLGNALLGEPLSRGELLPLARRLGADVPFFLAGGSQWGRGIGDELTPQPVESMHFLLLMPPFGCPTAEVYKTYAAELNSARQQASIPLSSAPPFRDPDVRGGLVNDLEAAAERIRPELGGLRRRLEARGFGGARMAGSGSTLFLTFADAAALAAAEDALRDLEAEAVRLVATGSGPQQLLPPAPGPMPAWDG